MSGKTMLKGKSLAWLLSAAYFTSYITRVNFAAIIQEVVTDTGHAKTALSIILVCLSISYGIGQIVNGRLGDIIKPQKLILCGLVIATSVNLIFPLFSSSVPMMTVLWTINGFAQAMMWPPMVKILVANCDDAMYGYSVLRISWASSGATILIYLIAPFIIKIFTWRGVFIFSALMGFLTIILWCALQSRIEVSEVLDAEAVKVEKKAKLNMPKLAIFPLIFIALGIILQGMLRDGISSWMPTVLAEELGLGNSKSIFITVLVAIFSIVSLGISKWIYEKFFTNEVFCAVYIFGLAAIMSALMFVFYEGYSIVILMPLITSCMHGINLMLITYVPKRFKKYGNISTISGAINACTYIGAAISTYGIAWLSEIIGWRNTYGVWFIVAILGTIVCIVATRPWKRFFEK